MANLFITELDRAPVSTGGGAHLQIARLPPVHEQTVPIGATSAQSTPFNANTRFVCLHAKADCHIVVGPDPTATPDHKPVAAGQDVYFGVTPSHRLAVIAP